MQISKREKLLFQIRTDIMPIEQTYKWLKSCATINKYNYKW